jgi:hypothetical protein
MATTKIAQSESYTQGLIQYLKDTSQCSRDNIFLRELGNAQNLKRKLHALLEDWTLAQARSLLVQWVEAYDHGHGQPSKVPLLQKLPPRLTRVEAETSPLGSFFGDRERANLIRRSQTVSEQKRWSLYFDRWGCLACQRRNVPHASNGMCEECRARTYWRLKGVRE